MPAQRVNAAETVTVILRGPRGGYRADSWVEYTDLELACARAGVKRDDLVAALRHLNIDLVLPLHKE